MDAERALADLVEISPQIEAAATFGSGGAATGAVGVADASGAALARAGQALLEAARELRGDAASVTQVHASLSGGEVFAVRAGERSVVAVAASPQAPGLVFYDLKRCLASQAAEEPGSKPQPGRRLFRWREGDDAS